MVHSKLQQNNSILSITKRVFFWLEILEFFIVVSTEKKRRIVFFFWFVRCVEWKFHLVQASNRYMKHNNTEDKQEYSLKCKKWQQPIAANIHLVAAFTLTNVVEWKWLRAKQCFIWMMWMYACIHDFFFSSFSLCSSL